MIQFTYKVRDHAGDLATGNIAAASAEEAAQMLRSEGKFIVKIEQAKRAAAAAIESKAQAVQGGIGGRVKRRDVITFAHQMAVMIDTGVPISEALECAAEQINSEAFQAVIKDVTEQVHAGGALSLALSQHPKVFPPVMVSLIQASEASGTMGKMLDRVSTYMQKEAATVKKIRGALTYPAVMLLMVIGVTVFLLTFVLPRFAGIYTSKGAALPLPTQALMTLSDTLTHFWYGWTAGLVLLIVGFMVGRRTLAGRRLLDRLKLSLPVIGPLFRKLYITRSCRTMGTMIDAGVPILDMVAIVRAVTANVYFEDLWDNVDEKLRQGSQLSDGLLGSPLIPRSVCQMIFSGEKAGRLGSIMERIAEFTEDEFDDAVKNATQFIEPAMITVMGLIIGFVAISMLLPIFNVGKVVSG